MKKKNGFVFIETMIVVVVLVTILLIIYSSYTSLISLEKRLARYDDPIFIYRTKAIGDFLVSLKDDDGNSIIGNRIKENEKNNNFINISTDDDDLFNEGYINGNINRQSYFSQMYANFNVQSIIIINKDQLDDLKNNDDIIFSDFYRYLKSINAKDGDVFLVVMYAEKINGDSCNPNELVNVDLNDKNVNKENSCTYYYSNLKIEQEGAIS